MTPECSKEHRTHKHGSGQMAPYWGLSSESVVVVVGNYKFVTWIYETGHLLGMLLKLIELRRILIAPILPDIGQKRILHLICLYKCKKLKIKVRIFC